MVRFVQPAYPGDPRGMADPNPLAHQPSQDSANRPRITGPGLAGPDFYTARSGCTRR